MDQKNLDELFREKFKAFREVPDEKVWTAIERSLDKKRKRRVVPLWWKLGGIAAALAIALIALYPFWDASVESPAVTDTENTEVIDVDNEDAEGNGGRNADIKKDKEDVLPIIETPDDGIQVTANERQEIRGNTEGKDTIIKELNPILKNKNTDLIGNRNTDALATTKTDASNSTDTLKTDIDDKNRDTSAIAQGESQIAIERERDEQEREKLGSEKLTREEVTQNEIADEVANKTAETDKTSELAEKAAAEKSIFEALEDQADEEKIADGSNSRWSAGPSVAPVYFNAIGEGSPIDPGFAANSKSGGTNLSYGLSIAYAINDRLRVRSGIHKAEYGYDTNDVDFSPTLAASSSGRLQNVNNAGSSANVTFDSPNSSLESSDAVAPEFNALSSARDGTVAQSFGYLEVPLELDYALVDRKFGVNLIGGISSLFLLDNSVTLSSGDLKTDIGEARNLNDLNFSTNIGFGVNYKFTPKVQLNIEPVFKYQLNTFSDTSGDFRPYSIGVYSGLNFRF
jgi:hypothetical protein